MKGRWKWNAVQPLTSFMSLCSNIIVRPYYTSYVYLYYSLGTGNGLRHRHGQYATQLPDIVALVLSPDKIASYFFFRSPVTPWEKGDASSILKSASAVLLSVAVATVLMWSSVIAMHVLWVRKQTHVLCDVVVATRNVYLSLSLTDFPLSLQFTALTRL